jgi:hypothetical protein
LASDTVQVLAAFALRLLGEQTIEDSVAAVVKLMEAVLEAPLSVAVTVTLRSEETVPAEATKLAVVAPAATVTEEGTVISELLSEIETAVPLPDAALERATVQVLVWFEVRLVGAQVSEESETGADRSMEAVLETPLRVAVTVAV